MKKYILLIALALGTFAAQAQFENKLTGYAYFGLPFYGKAPATESPSTQMLTGYKPVPYLGVGALYSFNTKFSAGVNLRGMTTYKNFGDNGRFQMSDFGMNLVLKYNIIHNDKPISPFIQLEAGGGITRLVQDSATVNVSSPADLDPEHIAYEGEQQLKLPRITNNYFTQSVMIGAGVDFVIKQKYGVFVSANYLLNNADRNSQLQEDFPENESKLNFLMIQAGIKFSFLKSKSLI